MLWLISCLALVASTVGCGVPALKPQISGYNRIVNGENAVSGSWPWQVSLQVGIVSWGTTNCNVRAPAVYARISYLRGWIDQTIASN